MAPSHWRNRKDIGALKELEAGSGLSSKWPPIVTAIKQYEGLQANDSQGRASVLNTLKNAITVWNDNQAGFFTIVKDKDLVAKKRAALEALQQLIQSELQELASPPPQSSPMVPVIKRSAPISLPTASKPISIGAPTNEPKRLPMQKSQLPQQFAQSWDNPVVEKISRGVWQNASGQKLTDVTINDAQVEEFNKKVKVYVHFTKPNYKVGIFHGGLIPGKETGIGVPDENDHSKKVPDTEHVYVVDGAVTATTSAVSTEAGGEVVVVVSLVTPTSPDNNYKAGGAYYFTGKIPHVRNANQPNNDSRTFSFTLPMGPRTAQGLCNLLNSGMTQSLNVDQAAALLLRYMNKNFPLHI